jgi:hypothetical protein
MISKTIIKMSPNFHPTLKFYLTTVFLFSANDFSQISLISELSLLLGILALNTIFKDTNRKSFLRTNGLVFMVVNVTLIPILVVLSKYSEISPLLLILVFSALHSLIYEIFNVPMVSIFLEICPENLEGFFMSVIFFVNNFARNISMFLGSMIVFALNLNWNNLPDVICLIFIHVSFNLIGFIGLLFSHIPDKPKHRRMSEEKIEEVENKHLAYINSAASIMVEGNKTLADITVNMTRLNLSIVGDEEKRYFTSAEKGELATNGKLPYQVE